MPCDRWPAVRCGQCGRSLGTPLALELPPPAVLALLLGRFGGQPDMVAFAFFGVLGVALAAIDVAVQRLPDPLTLPAYPILIALLAVAAIASHDAAALVRALLGGLALAAASCCWRCCGQGSWAAATSSWLAWPGSPWAGWAGPP